MLGTLQNINITKLKYLDHVCLRHSRPNVHEYPQSIPWIDPQPILKDGAYYC